MNTTGEIGKEYLRC